MNDPFTLTIDYKGTARNFTGLLLLQGYSHRIKVLVDDNEVFFEPDEEGGYRVVTMPGQEGSLLEKIDKQILFLLQQKIQEILQ